MTAHHITFGRDAHRYHIWTCSCGTDGDPSLLRRTARSEAMEHVARPNACHACGSSIPDDRTVCGALECGLGELPSIAQANGLRLPGDS